MNSPTPDQIKQARKDAGLTKSQAADIVSSSLRAWQYWEKGDRAMPKAAFDLFLIKTKR
ncbi:MAG: hypothetical protein WAW61_22265 [Methylococcaceae bacterium]